MSLEPTSSHGQEITQPTIFGTILRRKSPCTPPISPVPWKNLSVLIQRSRCIQFRVTMTLGLSMFKIFLKSTATGPLTISNRAGLIKLGWARRRSKYLGNGVTTPSHLNSTQKEKWLVWTCRLAMTWTGGCLMTELIQDSSFNGLRKSFPSSRKMVGLLTSLRTFHQETASINSGIGTTHLWRDISTLWDSNRLAILTMRSSTLLDQSRIQFQSVGALSLGLEQVETHATPHLQLSNMTRSSWSQSTLRLTTWT